MEQQNVQNQLIDNELINAVLANKMAQQNVNQVVVSTDGSMKVDTGLDQSMFMKADGSVVTNQWIQSNAVWYHAGTNGLLDKGWQSIGNKLYYFEEATNANKYVMHTGWLQYNYNGIANLFYMSNQGDMTVGYQTINGNTYYFNETNDKGYIGTLMINQMTPDGRFAGSDGIVR